jgi:hypothetical protein
MRCRFRILSAISIFTLLFVVSKTSLAQEVENEFQSRLGLDLSYKPLKKLKLSFTPEMRFDEDFSLANYLFEGGVEYKPVKFLELEAIYRFAVNPRDNKDTEYASRYSFGATAKKEFGRFEPSFRLRYGNDADDVEDDEEFMRYKAKLKYDIANCKITPFVAAEAFQELSDAELYKMRYSAGLDYKLFKNNYIQASYKFDYYKNEYKNRNIISLGYKIKF